MLQPLALKTHNNTVPRHLLHSLMQVLCKPNISINTRTRTRTRTRFKIKIKIKTLTIIKIKTRIKSKNMIKRHQGGIEYHQRKKMWSMLLIKMISDNSNCNNNFSLSSNNITSSNSSNTNKLNKISIDSNNSNFNIMLNSRPLLP